MTGKWSRAFSKKGEATLSSEWNFEVAAQPLKKEVILPDPLKAWSGASIDTRTLKSGEVFFALSGKNQDGHRFLWEAFQRGASGAVIGRDFFRKERERLFRERALFHNLIPVSNPEEALATLSGFYRSHFSAVGVGVTGSVGKTSTKEFLRFLLSQKYPILASSGNWNNHLGLPLTLFQLKPEHQYCVGELGANHRGEIRRLSSLLKPRIGIITGVAPVHLEGFGSLKGVYDAKLELADAIAKARGTLVLPDRDPELIRRAKKRRLSILLFGRERTSEFRLTDAKAQEGWIEMEVNDRWQFKFPGYALFQAENALAALAASFVCGVSLKELPSLWTDALLPKGRFEIFSPREGVTFVNDCYNANPYSFQKSLEAFEGLEERGRKILVLGDMRELGTEAVRYHQELGERISQKNFQVLFTVGDLIRHSTEVCEREGNPPLVLHFESKEMLTDFLGSFLKPGDQVLFKASRSLKLEEVMSALSFPLSPKGSPTAL